MDKYYTPEREEFHIGFEYEHNNVSIKPIEEQKWVFAICSSNTLSGIEYDLSETCKEKEFRNKSIRVKRLDKEDIESLGFVLQSEGNGRLEFHKLGDENVYLTLIGRKVTIQVRFTGMLEIDIDHLIIKNKSELEKILKMIGLTK